MFTFGVYNMNRSGKTPTMKDVAREAGVALGTVSKVFNGIPVGASYRQKVEEAAERLGYSVNSYARGLRASKTHTVALIVPSLRHTFFSAFADYVCQELTRRNHRMLVATTDFDPDAEARCIQMVRQNRVDGIIGLTYAPNLEISDDLPYVSIDRYISPNIPCVASDNYAGGGMAAEKLIELGCKSLLFLRLGSTVIGETDKRGAGFAAYCDMKGAQYTIIRHNDADGMEAIYRFLDRHIQGGRLEYDGLFCNTDRLTYFVRRHLERRGIRIPKDVQMIGYDGTQKFSTEDYYCSTIVQPIQQMARTAVDVLLREDRTQVPALICLPVHYAPGGTTREPLNENGDDSPWQANT